MRSKKAFFSFKGACMDLTISGVATGKFGTWSLSLPCKALIEAIQGPE